MRDNLDSVFYPACNKPKDMAVSKKRHSIKEFLVPDEMIDMANGTSVLLTPDTTPTKSDMCDAQNDKSSSPSRKHSALNHGQAALVRSLSDSLLSSPKLPSKITKCEKHSSASTVLSVEQHKSSCEKDCDKGKTRQAKGRKGRGRKPAAKHKSHTSENGESVKSSRARSTSIPSTDRKTTCSKTTLLTDYFPVRRSSRVPSKELKSQKQTDVEKAILNGCEDGLKVVTFEGKGRGVIATKPFKRGDFVVEYVGDTIDLATAKKRELSYSDNPEFGCYMYYFNYRNQSYCVDATAESDKLGRLLNHSKANRNCATKVVGIDNKPYLILVAHRDIVVGEELLYDYGDRSKSSLEAHPWLAF